MEFEDSGSDTLLPLIENRLSRRAAPFVFALVAVRFKSGVEADFLIAEGVAGTTGSTSFGGGGGAQASCSSRAGADSFSKKTGPEDGRRASPTKEAELDLFGIGGMKGSSGRGGGSLSMYTFEF